jgi:hypothetical protein
MRNEMIGAVVRRAIEHAEFRRRLVRIRGKALTAHGFVLEDSDLAELDNVRTKLGNGATACYDRPTLRLNPGM